uniref:Reverse transcriptase domain-containing protein n=1 Tax=Caenorhabditis japonica TaxID=281687 RepID=A0A8R1IS18_CAEJA
MSADSGNENVFDNAVLNGLGGNFNDSGVDDCLREQVKICHHDFERAEHVYRSWPPTYARYVNHKSPTALASLRSVHDQLDEYFIRAGSYHNATIEAGNLHHLTAALNQVLANGRTPEDWRTVKISLLTKPTKPKKGKDYRPVTFSSIISKLFTKILTKRITAKSEDYLEESQAGFRRGKECADNIQVVSQIWEKCTEFKIPLVAVFLDFSCAFDNLDWKKISDVLKNLKIGE